MDENLNIEAARQELAMLQAEIDTLRARKSMVECVRETFAQTQPVKVLKRKVRHGTAEVTILEADFQRLTEQAQAATWVERKLSELKYLGDRLWHQLNQKTILTEAIQRAEAAEMHCRRLDQQLSQARAERIQAYDLDDGADREIDPFTWDDREL